MKNVLAFLDGFLKNVVLTPSFLLLFLPSFVLWLMGGGVIAMGGMLAYIAWKARILLVIAGVIHALP